MKYLVDFHHETTEAQISQYLADNNCTVLKEWDNYDKVFLVEASVEPPKTEIVEFVTNDESLTIQPVDTVDFNPYYCVPNPNYPSATFSTTDQQDWWKNYTLQNPVFDEPTASISRKGHHVSVYIMDSGIEASHPEFENVTITNIYTVTPDDFSDNRGHGTALASVIAGKNCGITSAKLKIVKIFDPNHGTLQSEFLDALDAIMNDIPTNGFAVVNCSWTIPRNEWVEHKMRQLLDKGAWIFAAAGNNGTSIQDVTPAAMPEAFTVGAYNIDLEPCDFSNYTGTESSISVTANATNHGELDGWAPGENIYAAQLAKLGGGYAYTSGTSIATAILSAVAAHNVADLVDANGQKEWGAENLMVAGLNAEPTLVVSRQGLLDLSDPKYAGSVNSVATLGDLSNANVKLPPDAFSVSVRVGEDKSLVRVFSPYNTKSVNITSPLPNNFKILSSGILYGKPTASEGPDAGETYKLYTVTFDRTDLQDVVENCTIDIYVLNANYAPTDLPEDHVINITLAAGTCADAGFGYSGCYFYTNPPCTDNCPGGSVCCDPGGKNNMCFCFSGFSDRRLKSNIKRIGTHRLGIGLYEYVIFGRREIGVMADEVANVKPEAVILDKSGYYKVCYNML